MADIGGIRDDLLQNWSQCREMVIAQVESLGEDQLGWRPGAGARTGLEIADHIARSSRALLDHGVRGKAPDFSPTEPRSREEVLSDLRDGLGGIQSDLASLSEQDLTEQVPGLFGGESPRLGSLTFAYAHEMYHYGQLGLCARAGGEVPTLTQYLEQQAGG